MKRITESHGCFNLSFYYAGEPGYLSIHPEMYPARLESRLLAPTVYCMHPVHGICTFRVEQNEKGIWDSDRHPPFILKTFIQEIGREIEKAS